MVYLFYGVILGVFLAAALFWIPRQAAWEKMWDGSFRCTRCKYRTRVDADYCPNCGANTTRKVSR